MRGLLKPLLLVRPSARPLVCPVRAPSALIRPSARPPIPHLPACLSFAPRPPVRPSASRPPARHSPPVRPSASVRPSAPRPPRPRHPKNYLPLSSGPQFFTTSTPRQIATSAIRGTSRSHSGITVSKLPPLPSQP